MNLTPQQKKILKWTYGLLIAVALQQLLTRCGTNPF